MAGQDRGEDGGRGWGTATLCPGLALAKAAMDDGPFPREDDKLVLPKQSRVFFFILLGLFLWLSWSVIKSFAIYLISGTFVAVLALPIDKFWERFFRNRIAAVMTMLTLFLIITIPLVVLGAAMAGDAKSLADSVNNGELDRLADKALDSKIVLSVFSQLHPGQNRTELNATFHASVDQGKVFLQDELRHLQTTVLEGIPEFFVAITLILFAVYYVLTEDFRLSAYLRRAAPLPTWQMDYIMHEARQSLNAVFIGQMFTALIQGVLGGIGLWICGIPNPVLWGAVMALLGLLPVVGTFMVWIPASIWLIVNGHQFLGIFQILWGTFVVMILVDNVIRPYLIGSRADIHPMFVLLGVLGGALTFGFIGLFLGPLLLAVTVSLFKVWEADYMDPRINQLDQDLQAAIPAAQAKEPEAPPS